MKMRRDATKQLTLNKRTVSHLNSINMKLVLGGQEGVGLLHEDRKKSQYDQCTVNTAGNCESVDNCAQTENANKNV